VAAIASSSLDNSLELESTSLAVGTVDETASCNWFFLVDGLHLRNPSTRQSRHSHSVTTAVDESSPIPSLVCSNASSGIGLAQDHASTSEKTDSPVFHTRWF